ncbi:MAG TPA: SRPBCC family protein [Propionibacteriaceae bacterium]|nr:SRPBCC family protein [Propionibacteriaceae bacterium]
MSVRLEAATEVAAPVTRVWDELVDWPGQSRWIPLTTVRIVSDHDAGLGVRAAALSGFWLGRVPLGLLDRFVVTGWTPPVSGVDGQPRAELEVRHVGPYFTGVGSFGLRGHETGTTVSCVELFDLPGGRLLDPVGRLLRPVLQRGLGASLKKFAAVCEPV